MPHLLDNYITRRQAFRAGATSVAGYWLSPLLNAQAAKPAERTKPRNSARFVIFLMLDGGQSHLDTWDLKEGKWTPPNFDVREVQPGVKWPMGLYPKLSRQLHRTAIVRSLEAWDSVHGRAQYYVQSAHSLNPSLHKEIPSVGSVVAMEWQQRRKPSDSLPSYVALNVVGNQSGLLKSGFLPALYSPFHIQTETDLNAYVVDDEQEKRDFQRRWALLKDFDARLRNDPSLQAKAFRDYNDHYESAVKLLADPRTAPLFQLSMEEKTRYGTSSFGDACLIARNLVEADSGTHFIFVLHDGWDHHQRIYEDRNIYHQSRELDPALSSLLEDLGTRKRANGSTLLDETLIVTMGEFGRTPGNITEGLKGRDHYQYAFTGLFAGGGVKGGQIIGKTSDDGGKVVDSGWGVKRSIYMEDIATTIYSAMGIDWRKTVKGTPSGRDFYYIEPFASQKMIVSREIEPLFG
ncbi:MAG: DUF1501 domain-containing protein [Acidobacteria bacterium]|nr:DUF1501 domain-containing protein [Acidobacteriota bacterium]